MRRLRTRIVIFSAVTLVIVGTRWVSTGRLSGSAIVPGSAQVGFAVLEQETPDPTESVRGEIESDGMIVVRTRLRNSGSSVASIDAIRTGCGCTAAAIGQRRIPPGGVADLKLTVNPLEAPLRVLEPDLLSGVVRVLASCRIDGAFQALPGDSYGTLPVDIHAELSLPLRLDAAAMDFGSLSLHTGPSTQVINVFLQRGWGILDVSSPLPAFRFELQPPAADVDSTAMQLTGVFEPGRVDGSEFRPSEGHRYIRLTLADVREQHRTTIDVPVFFRIKPPITAIPQQVVFAGRRSQNDAARTIRLQTDGVSVHAIRNLEILSAPPGIQITEQDSADNGRALCVRLVEPTTDALVENIVIKASVTGSQEFVDVEIPVIIAGGRVESSE